MIFLDKDTTNRVVLTLDESSRLTNPFYLFHIKNEFDMDDNGFTYYTPDLSGNRGRYNLFNFTESSSGSTTGGFDIPLKLVSGQYRYTIYESTAATTSLSATTGYIIEEGRLVVAKNNNDINSIYF